MVCCCPLMDFRKTYSLTQALVDCYIEHVCLVCLFLKFMSYLTSGFYTPAQGSLQKNNKNKQKNLCQITVNWDIGRLNIVVVFLNERGK